MEDGILESIKTIASSGDTLFDVCVNCNLTKNTYDVYYSRGKLGIYGASSGVLDKYLSDCLGFVSPLTKSVVRDSFSRESLLEFFENEDNTFLHTFFTYEIEGRGSGDASMTVLKMENNDEDNVICLLFAKSMGDIYGETLDKRLGGLDFKEYRELEKCRLAVAFGPNSDDYLAWGGSALIENADTLPKTGLFRDLLSFVCDRFFSSADKKDFLLAFEKETLLANIKVYGGHWIKRYLMRCGEEQRWQEIIVVSLDSENGVLLLIINDVQDRIAKQAFISAMSRASGKLNSAIAKKINFDRVERNGEMFCEVELKPGVPVTSANEHFFNIIGFTKEEFQIKFGNLALDLCHPADIRYVAYNYEMSLKSSEREVHDLEIRIIKGNGDVRWLNLSIFHQKEGDIVKGYLVGRDITDEKISSQKSLFEQIEMEHELSKDYNAFFDYDFTTHALTDRYGMQNTLGLPGEIRDFDKWYQNNDIVHPDYHDAVSSVIEKIEKGAISASVDLKMRAPKMDDKYIWVRVSVSVIYSNESNPIKAVGVIEDIDEIKVRFNNVDATVNSNVTESDDVLIRLVLNLSQNQVEMYQPLHQSDLQLFDGHQKSCEVVLKNIADFYVAENMRKSFLYQFNKDTLLNEYYRGNTDITKVLQATHRIKGDLWIKCITHIVLDTHTKDVKALIYGVDVTQKYNNVLFSEEEAGKDLLTGVFNRRHAVEVIKGILDNSSAEDNSVSAFAIINVDDFRSLNESYGYQNGDIYLRQLAENLLQWGTSKDIVFRVSGDEFAVFLDDYPTIENIEMRLQDLEATLLKVSKNHTPSLSTSASVGVALYPKHGKTYDELHNCAEAALKYAKKNKKGSVVYYDFVSIFKKSPVNAIHQFINAKKNDSTNLIFSTMMVALILLGISFMFFSLAANSIHRQSKEILDYHNIVYANEINQYIENNLNNAKKVEALFKNEYGWILETEEFEEENTIPADIYIPADDFDGVYLITTSGKVLYPYGRADVTISDKMINELYPSYKTYALAQSYEMLEMNIAISFVSTIKSDVYLVSAVSDTSLCEYLDSIMLYAGEGSVLFSRDKQVIAASNSMSQFIGQTLNELADEFNVKDKNALKHNASGSLVVEYSKQNYCMAIENVYSKESSGVVEWSLLSVAPEFSLVSHVLHSILALFGICVSICLGVFFFTHLSVLEHKKKAEKMEELAFRDNLTLLNNMNYLTANFKHNKKNMESKMAFVSLNIDDFRLLKDTYGFKESNNVIRAVGEAVFDKIQANEIGIRVLDDKFCLVLDYIDKESFVERIKRIRKYVYSNIKKYTYNPINITISIGVYVYESLGDKLVEPSMAYDYADTARNQSKLSKDEKITFYNADLQQKAQAKKEMEDNLALAFRGEEFVPFFQPVVSDKTGKVVSAEVLVRWMRNDGSITYPDKFIPILEENGQITKLDYYMFERVCAALQKWDGTSMENLLISVNMSRQHFYQPEFVQELMRIVSKYDVEPSKIQIEITESIYVGDMTLINATVEKLRKCGFLISIDDFGTGYSSMSILQKLPINILKIDKQFIDSGFDEEKNTTVLEGIIKIAKGLGLKIICEGVETKEQVEALKEMGCEFIQGYYYSKPISMTEFETYSQNAHN